MRPVSFPFLVYSRSTHPLPLPPPRRSLSIRQFSGAVSKSPWTSSSVLFLSKSGSARMSSTDLVPPFELPQPTLFHGFGNSSYPIYSASAVSRNNHARTRTGAANIRLPLVRACCCYYYLIDPFLPINQGLARVVETRFHQTSFSHHVSGNVSEEPLDEIQPGTRSGGEMHVKSGMFLHPGFDLGMLVSAVVVGNQMDVESLGGVSRSICLRNRSHSTWVC